MKKILVMGAGRIGRLLARFLHESPDYDVTLSDTQPILSYQDGVSVKTTQLDAANTQNLRAYLADEKINVVVSCLPYFLNQNVARVAHAVGITYFDLTEDVGTTRLVKELAQSSQAAMVPQCGLAPGFVNIVASDLVEKLDFVDTLALRVGALPESSSHPLKYALTWSVDGLINEYCKPCPAIIEGRYHELTPLEGLENIELLNIDLEAFNTSGGIGSLIETYASRIKNITYKTLRYPGHAALMKFLLTDLNLKDDREVLKKILMNALPESTQDCVYLYVSVKGWVKEKRTEETFIKKYLPVTLFNEHYSAIAVTTAASCAAVMDLLLQRDHVTKGLVRQEDFSLRDVLANRFGRYLGTVDNALYRDSSNEGTP